MEKFSGSRHRSSTRSSLLTKNFQFQQNLAALPMPVFVLVSHSTALSALEAFARLLPVAGVLCLAAGAALVVLGWIGTTTLVLMLPAAERVFPVRGQSPLLVEFAELLAERVAQRNGR